MSASAVNTNTAISQMIADISEIPSATDTSGLGFPMRQSILEKLHARIDSEPARVVTDTEGLIIEINPAFTQLCGHSFADLKGRKPGAMLQGPKSRPASVAALREAIRSREPVTTELVNYHKDRSTYRVRIDLKPLFAPNGDFTGYEAEERKLQ